MKILFLGVFTPTSTNFGQARALSLQKHDVDCFSYREYQPVGVSVDKIHEKLKEEHFDLLVYSKCNNFPLSKTPKYTKSFLWYMDPMHNVNPELIEKAKQVDFVGCALWEPWQYLKRFNKNTFFIPEGFDEQVFHPVKYPVRVNVSFIGNLYDQRKEYLNAIPNVLHLNNVYNEEHNQWVCASRINLNFTKGGCSDRVYKILAAKGFLLTQSWPHMEDLFEPGKDFETFDSKDTMLRKIEHYVRNLQEREIIANHGYETVQKYTVTNWAKKVIEVCNGNS